jgi:hypothetical protein
MDDLTFVFVAWAADPGLHLAMVALLSGDLGKIQCKKFEESFLKWIDPTRMMLALQSITEKPQVSC